MWVFLTVLQIQSALPRSLPIRPRYDVGDAPARHAGLCAASLLALPANHKRHVVPVGQVSTRCSHSATRYAVSGDSTTLRFDAARSRIIADSPTGRRLAV